MPLPAGFKVNGTTRSSAPVPPRITKIMMLLDKVPMGELLTSNEVGARASLAFGGSWACHPALADYREKVDSKYFWGSMKSIRKLREQLAEPEDTDGEN
jgi:hypothetical protein